MKNRDTYNENIKIEETATFNESKCRCGEEVGFLVSIYGTELKLCHKCVAELGKEVINALL